MSMENRTINCLNPLKESSPRLQNTEPSQSHNCAFKKVMKFCTSDQDGSKVSGEFDDIILFHNYNKKLTL